MNFPYLTHPPPSREATLGGVTIYEYERGLLYKRGQFLRELGPGRYRLWPFTHQRIAILDLRRASVQVINQKLLTADQITVTLNLVAEYEVADATAAVHKVTDFRTHLYEDLQLSARQVVGASPVDDLLRERVRVNGQILDGVRPLAEGYGLRVLHAAIKDLILAPRVRDLLMKEAEAKRVAQAMLIGAREEVATLRALANAARLAAEHPQLLRLRELDAIRSFAQTPGNTVVVGMPGPVLPLRAPRQASGEEGEPGEGEA
jgi:regulator of protease activity HflC (stomatin/prohibitin superfamily)